jgi:hypothetical protein
MNLKFISNLLVLIPFAWTFFYLLRRRKFFRSVYPFGFAALFLGIARISDTLIATQGSGLCAWLGITRESFDSFIAVVGNVTGVAGAFLLVFGFVRALESLSAGEKRIQSLETLLPICAWCKRVRTDEGIWKPVEEYLRDKGAPEATHGICPDCAARVLHDKRGDWTSEEPAPGRAI